MQQISRWLLVIGCFILVSAQAFTLEEFRFETPQQETEFRQLISTLRCLVCQNESLAGSQAELAQDLRKEVYTMMRQGQSSEDIIVFLTDRYGDFVLYDPPLKPSTYVLWFGPVVLILIAAFFMLRALIRHKNTPPPDLTAAEREQLQHMLATQTPTAQDHS